MHVVSELLKLVVSFVDQRVIFVPRIRRSKNQKDFYFEDVIFLNVEIPPMLLNFV